MHVNKQSVNIEDTEVDDILSNIGENPLVQEKIDQDVKDSGLFIPIKSDESLLSWLIRQSLKFGLSPRNFISAEKNYWLLNKNIELKIPKNWNWLNKIDIFGIPSDLQTIFSYRGFNIENGTFQPQILSW